MSLREHVSLREHACVSSRGAQSTELVWILDFKQILLLLLCVYGRRCHKCLQGKGQSRAHKEATEPPQVPCSLPVRFFALYVTNAKVLHGGRVIDDKKYYYNDLIIYQCYPFPDVSVMSGP